MTQFLPVVLPMSSAGCRRCEQLPPPLHGPGTIYLKFPLAHSRSKILKYLFELHLPCEHNDDIVSIPVTQAEITPLLRPLQEVLSSTEQSDVRVLFQSENHELELSDCFETDSLNVFLARAQSQWLVEMMEEKRLTSWFQPIVSCDDSAQVFAYECLLRGAERDGSVVLPSRILDVARGAGLLFQLDRAARLTAIACAAQQQLSTRIFINFTPTSIYDPVNCLKSTVAAVDAAGFARERIVFEVIESDFVQDVNHLKTILDYYRGSGFGVALDDVGAGYSSLNLLTQLHPDYLKLDRELVTGVHADSYKATIVRKLLETAREIGVKAIAEGIETYDEFAWLRDNGADYIQGYFFARPAAIPPVVVLPVASFSHAA